jgi:histidine triad (HIT) family protein
VVASFPASVAVSAVDGAACSEVLPPGVFIATVLLLGSELRASSLNDPPHANAIARGTNRSFFTVILLGESAIAPCRFHDLDTAAAEFRKRPAKRPCSRLVALPVRPCATLLAAMSCLFCDIAEGKEPAAIVHRDEQFCAFLDVRPVFKGHVLVIPRAHAADFGALPAASMGPFFALVRRVSAAVQRSLEAQGSFIAINDKVSQSQPHLHVHVVPRTKGDGLRGFFWPRTKYLSTGEQEGYARRIADALSPP